MQPPLSPIAKERFAFDENDPLRKIVQVILQTCQPEQIFAFNCGFIVKHNSLIADFLILLPHGADISFIKLKKTIEEGCAKIGSVTVILEDPSSVYKSIKQGHIFFSWVCCSDNLIYDTGNYQLPETPTIDTKLIVEKSRSDFNLVYKRAQAFLDGGRYYLAFSNHRMVAFMLSQATVQVLIAFLAALTGYKHFTHNIIRLFRLARRITEEFVIIPPLNHEETMELLGLLNYAYSKSRYSNKFAVSEQQVISLIAMVVTLFSLVASEFEECLQEFEWKFNNK